MCQSIIVKHDSNCIDDDNDIVFEFSSECREIFPLLFITDLPQLCSDTLQLINKSWAELEVPGTLMSSTHVARAKMCYFYTETVTSPFGLLINKCGWSTVASEILTFVLKVLHSSVNVGV